MKWVIIKTGLFALALSACATSIADSDSDALDREFAGGADLSGVGDMDNSPGSMRDLQRYPVLQHSGQVGAAEPAARPGPVPWIEGTVPPENGSSGSGSSKP